MNAPLDITGQRYGRLVAVKRVAPFKSRTTWEFVCDCGNAPFLALERVRSGMTKSCGCLRAETTASRSVTHGQSRGRKRSRTLKSYQHAKSRCTNPKDAKYPVYGGRGITMCERWLERFENFFEDMGECPAGYSIGRIDVDKGYDPRNCRWETHYQQARARQDNVWVEHNGVSIILKDYAILHGVRYKALHSLTKYKGMSPEAAVQHLLSLK